MVDDGVASVAILSGRDLVRYGVQAMVDAAGCEVAVVHHVDPERPPDVVIVDLGGMTALEAAEFEDRLPLSSAAVIVLISTSIVGVVAAWQHPPYSVLTVAVTQREFVEILRSALDASLDGRFVRSIAASPQAAASGLSPRELQVIAAIALGRSNQQISDELFLGVNTVKTYIRTAYRKLGVRSRTQAVIWAFEHGLAEHGTHPQTAREGELLVEDSWTDGTNHAG